MSNLRQAAQDVLELVEWIKDNLDVVRAGGDMGISPFLIDKLRAALAEPQTTHWEGCEAVHPECRKPDTDCHAQGICQRSGYTLSPAPRKPLTKEERVNLVKSFGFIQHSAGYYGAMCVTHAVEAAHGITGEQT